MTYAQANDEFLCSGAFDPQVSNRRDGPVDRVGWVADQVNSKASMPGQMLCPANVAIYNQKLGTDGGTYTPNQARELVRRGYNTNYTQSWYMGRTEFKPGGTGNLKSITGTFWALHTSFLRSVDSSRVPLLGDGRSDPGAFVLGQRCVKTMGDVTAGANNTAGNENGVMQFVNDLTISAGGRRGVGFFFMRRVRRVGLPLRRNQRARGTSASFERAGHSQAPTQRDRRSRAMPRARP